MTDVVSAVGTGALSAVRDFSPVRVHSVTADVMADETAE